MSAGVPVEVIPGVTSAIAVPGLAGIPVTQRGVAATVVITSGHLGPDEATRAALAEGATVVALMAVGTMGKFMAAALDAGADPHTPVAIIECGSTSRERVTRATISDASLIADETGVKPPAVIVIGGVALDGLPASEVVATPRPQGGGMTVQGTPVLIGCAHGTSSPLGQRAVRDLLDAVRLALPGVDVREAYVDVHGPKLVDVIADVPVAEEGLAAVVVPLLLAGGYHVHHDIAEAVAMRPDVVVAPALGPDARLTAIVLDRLREAHVSHESTLVLAAAGSSDERAMADTEAAAEMLRGIWEGPVRVAYAAGHSPSVAEAVRSAHNYGEDGTVAVASFLLVPGVFQARLEEAGADVVTPALAPHPELVSIVIDRYGFFTHD